MAINVSDLPPKYQEQAMKKYMEQQKQRRGPAPPAAPPQDPAKGTKYHNTPTERVTASGAVLHFDSQKEARRFDVLAARQARGQIRDLRLQVDFTLQEAFTDTEGKRVRAIRYKADFTYYQPPNRQLYGSHAPYYAEQSGVPWEFVVEDVKSKATRTAKNRRLYIPFAGQGNICACTVYSVCRNRGKYIHQGLSYRCRNQIPLFPQNHFGRYRTVWP